MEGIGNLSQPYCHGCVPMPSLLCLPYTKDGAVCCLVYNTTRFPIIALDLRYWFICSLLYPSQVLFSVIPNTADPTWLKHHEVEHKLVFGSRMSLDGARENCRRSGGRLAEIHSRQDQDLLLYLAKKRRHEDGLAISEFLLGKETHWATPLVLLF